jgi:hypothetical protein
VLQTNEELLELGTQILNNNDSVFFIFRVGGHYEQKLITTE